MNNVLNHENSIFEIILLGKGQCYLYNSQRVYIKLIIAQEHSTIPSKSYNSEILESELM